MGNLYKKWTEISLVLRIVIGLVIGLILAIISNNTDTSYFSFIEIFGKLFVGALKAIAPVLVFFLVMGAMIEHREGQKSNIKTIIILYLVGTFLASLTAVIATYIHPVKLVLQAGNSDYTPPTGIFNVIENLLTSLVENPVSALMNGNYIGILFWSILFGCFLRKANESTKTVIKDVADVVLKTIKNIIEFAPFGIMGLIYNSITQAGFGGLKSYGELLILLLSCMIFVALVLNPLITFIMIRQNPYPLVLKCLRVSGVTAFFTRSSAANIPVNMNLCEELGLDEDVYSVSIPLGATINMAGAAITIAVFALSAAYTHGVHVDLFTAILLSLLAAVSACGASGVAGGSLLLIPLACSLFGLDNDIGIQVASIGFIIGVIQDSAETALNSSTDVLFTSIAEFAQWKREGKEIKIN